MSTTSYFSGTFAQTTPSASPVNPAKAGGGGLFARIMASIVNARVAQAQREANRYLARQPDRLLRDIGLNETEIADLKRQYEL